MKKILLLACLLLCSPALANENAALKSKVEDYLNSVHNFTADFTQVDSEGNVSGGKFLLKRPGRFKWEYDARQPILIVSDGTQLVYYDKKLKETSYAGAGDTLAGFLARKTIKLSGDIKLVDINEKDGVITAKVVQRDKPDQGALALFFDEQDMKLSKLQLTDANGYVTNVTLTNQKVGGEISDSEFVFHDPKYSKNPWEKD